VKPELERPNELLRLLLPQLDRTPVALDLKLPVER
jgi:hypothetical protein